MYEQLVHTTKIRSVTPRIKSAALLDRATQGIKHAGVGLDRDHYLAAYRSAYYAMVHSCDAVLDVLGLQRQSTYSLHVAVWFHLVRVGALSSDSLDRLVVVSEQLPGAQDRPQLVSRKEAGELIQFAKTFVGQLCSYIESRGSSSGS